MHLRAIAIACLLTVLALVAPRGWAAGIAPALPVAAETAPSTLTAAAADGALHAAFPERDTRSSNADGNAVDPPGADPSALPRGVDPMPAAPLPDRHGHVAADPSAEGPCLDGLWRPPPPRA